MTTAQDKAMVLTSDYDQTEDAAESEMSADDSGRLVVVADVIGGSALHPTHIQLGGAEPLGREWGVERAVIKGGRHRLLQAVGR